MVAVAIGVGAGVSGLSSIVGGSIASSGAQKAASTEAAATTAAVNAEQADFQQAYGLEQPYAGAGTTAETELSSELGLGGGTPSYGTYGELGAQPSLTDVSGLPGYQFTLQQGLNSVNNAASAQGLAAVGTSNPQGGGTTFSGVQGKGLATYAENLANTYYNNYISNYWTNQNNRYNMLAGLVNTGATAAGNLGNQAVQTGSNVANTTQAGANSVAAAQEASANATAGGVSGLGSSVSNALVANALLGNQSASTINSSGIYNPSSPAYVGGSGNVGGYYTSGVG
jgi:hypothetical protein